MRTHNIYKLRLSIVYRVRDKSPPPSLCLCPERFGISENAKHESQEFEAPYLVKQISFKVPWGTYKGSDIETLNIIK